MKLICAPELTIFPIFFTRWFKKGCLRFQVQNISLVRLEKHSSELFSGLESRNWAVSLHKPEARLARALAPRRNSELLLSGSTGNKKSPGSVWNAIDKRLIQSPSPFFMGSVPNGKVNWIQRVLETFHRRVRLTKPPHPTTHLHAWTQNIVLAAAAAKNKLRQNKMLDFRERKKIC